MNNDTTIIMDSAGLDVVREQFIGSERFDWISVALIGWLIGGLFLDGWAHNHLSDLETFITPWHGVLYSGFFASSVYIIAATFRNQLRGYPFRMAVPEKKALNDTFKAIRSEIKRTGCVRAVIVAHNAAFDQSFINAAVERCEIKRNPFHPFSTFDTATLCGLAFGQTVLARACEAAGMVFDSEEAHTAKYDCDKTAEIFCHIVNKWKLLGGLAHMDQNSRD